MRRPFLAVSASLVLVAFLGTSSPGYNKPGHRVSGAIAYAVLKQESPETIQKVVTILKSHPDYSGKWKETLDEVATDEHGLYLFMLAAEWPDVVKSVAKYKQYDHRPWHYINEPYKPEGQPASVKTIPPGADNNILWAFEKNQGIVQDASSDPQQRAVAICWVFHLMGDVHQPLHTTALFTTDYPKGDQGGNLVYVRIREDGSPLKLHSWWDGLILTSNNLRTARNRAIALRMQLPRDGLTELGEATTFPQWKDASFKLAKEVAYDNGKVTKSPDQDSAPVLPPGYVGKAKSTAERLIVLAGYRLADQLKKLP